MILSSEEFLNSYNILIQAGANPLLVNRYGEKPSDGTPYTNQRCPQWSKVRKAAFKDYLIVRSLTLTLAQGSRSTSGEFSKLPTELLAAIILYAVNSDYLETKTIQRVAEYNFARPFTIFSNRREVEIPPNMWPCVVL